MTPEREGRGPRQDKAGPVLRSEAKGKAKAEAEPKRSGPSWKKDGGPHEERGPAGDGGPDFGSR